MGQKRGAYRLNRQNAGLITRQEMAAICGCSAATLSLAIGRRFIPEPSHPGGPTRLLWHRSEMGEIKAGLVVMRRHRQKRPYEPPEGLLSIGQLAREFGRPRVTVYDWIQRGLMPRGTVKHRGHMWYEAKQVPKLRRVYGQLLETWGKPRGRKRGA